MRKFSLMILTLTLLAFGASSAGAQICIGGIIIYVPTPAGDVAIFLPDDDCDGLPDGPASIRSRPGKLPAPKLAVPGENTSSWGQIKAVLADNASPDVDAVVDFLTGNRAEVVSAIAGQQGITQEAAAAFLDDLLSRLADPVKRSAVKVRIVRDPLAAL